MLDKIAKLLIVLALIWLFVGMIICSSRTEPGGNPAFQLPCQDVPKGLYIPKDVYIGVEWKEEPYVH
jgi:hypothetical protein